MPSASSTTSANCGCCHEPPSPCLSLGTALLECRTRGGTGTLIGWLENAGFGSTPPRMYRNMQVRGSVCQIQFTNSNCSSASQGTSGHNANLNCQYDKVTGALVNSGADLVQSNAAPATGCSTTVSTVTTCPGSLSSFAAHPAFTYVNNATQTEENGTGACAPITGANPFGIATGTYGFYLSDEDLEADAISRLLAGAGGTWTAWFTAGGASCLGAHPVCCIASYEQRTTLTTFAYQPSQFRVTLTGLTASTAYHISVDILRSPRGAGTYTKIATHVYAFTTDGSGHYQFSDDIPLKVGYDTTIDVTTACVYP